MVKHFLSTNKIRTILKHITSFLRNDQVRYFVKQKLKMIHLL